MNVYEKLLQVQAKLKCNKSQYNSFGKYSYRSCEDILEALKPILAEVGAIVVCSDDIVFVEGKDVLEVENLKTSEKTTTIKSGRFYVKATIDFIDIESGEKITNTAYAREEENKKGMDGSQVTGSCSSYCRKYALNGMFAIDDTKDSDFTNQGNNNKPTTQQRPQQRPQQQPQPSQSASGLTIEGARLMHINGKYKERSLGALAEENPDYLKWLLTKAENLSPTQREAINLVLGK